MYIERNVELTIWVDGTKYQTVTTMKQLSQEAGGASPLLLLAIDE
jgi:hypothetical protein